MKPLRELVVFVIFALAAMVIILALAAWPTMILWNHLMPVIFGLPEITMLQSVGLILLTSILFRDISNKK